MTTATPIRAAFEPSKTASSAGASYVALGTALAYSAQALIITSSFDKSIWVSTDAASDYILVIATSSLTIDVSGNKQGSGRLAFPLGTQFSIKQGPDGAPTTGDISITAIYAR